MTTELFAQEMPGEQAESRRLARVSFLTLIPELRPQCVSDLTSMVFLEFVLVACERFKKELLKGTGQKARSGENVFAYLFRQALRQLADDSFINKSIGDALLLTFARMNVIHSQALNRALSNWKQVKRLKYSASFCKQLDTWAVKWNLDADWCRDYAIATLRNCLTDEYLKWSFLEHITPVVNIFSEARSGASGNEANQIALKSIYAHATTLLRNYKAGNIWKHWDWTLHELTSAVHWARLSLSMRVHGGWGDPPHFNFQWKEFEFERSGYNCVRESQSQYKRRMNLEFRLYLNEKERMELLALLQDENKTYPNTSPNHGALQAFRQELNKHVSDIAKSTVKATQGLVKTRKRPKLTEHLRWTVEYQICPVKGLTDIAAAYNADTSTVSRAVNESLSLIGLEKRPDAKPGRIAGRKNKYSKHLRALGR